MVKGSGGEGRGMVKGRGREGRGSLNRAVSFIARGTFHGTLSIYHSFTQLQAKVVAFLPHILYSFLSLDSCGDTHNHIHT